MKNILFIFISVIIVACSSDKEIKEIEGLELGSDAMEVMEKVKSKYDALLDRENKGVYVFNIPKSDYHLQEIKVHTKDDKFIGAQFIYMYPDSIDGKRKFEQYLDKYSSMYGEPSYNKENGNDIAFLWLTDGKTAVGMLQENIALDNYYIYQSAFTLDSSMKAEFDKTLLEDDWNKTVE